MAKKDQVLSVLMPVYNEERTLDTILQHVLAQDVVGEVICVDDGSKDKSLEILQKWAAKDKRIKLISQPANTGKGTALRRAISEITLPYSLVQDADLEYDPSNYSTLLYPLVNGRADVVYGVRGFAGQTAYSFWFVMGNKGVTLACNLLFDCYISDLETGYKALRSDLWKKLNLNGERFDIEPDITARVLRLGYRIHEVPISYYARNREEGKKLTWVDGVHALVALMKRRLASNEELFGEHDNYHRERQDILAHNHPLRIE